MTNQKSPENQQGLAVELMVDTTNRAFIYAAGDQVASAEDLAGDDPSAAQLVQHIKSFGGLTTPVASSATNVELLPENLSTDAATSRKGVAIENASTATLYIRLGDDPASTGTYLKKIAPDGYYEVPYNPICAIQGIWSAADGFAMVTEFI